MELTNIQKTIVTTDKPKVVVLSSAASGKSRVIVERIRYLLEQGVDPSKIVAITFTNNAASVMYERLDYPNGLFIGTVHSYCNYLLRGNAIDTTDIIKQERFDDLFEEIQNNPQCIKEVDYLLLDEAQDSTSEQFKFFELINPKNFMYVGDIKQTIYSFNGSNPQYLIDLWNRDDVTVYKMTQNFRNLPDILRFAKKFLYRLGPEYDDDSIAMKESDGLPHVLEGEYTPSEAVESLIKWKNELKVEWKDWFVLCRTNKDIEIFKNLFAKKEIPTDTFKQAELTNSQIQDRLKENSIKILTVHSAKGMENKCVLSFNIRAYKDEEARLCYVSATRAKDFLIWARMPKKKKSKKKIVSWE
jgi:DNA helicase-2/ATP-dependent DNA helicase PcrA